MVTRTSISHSAPQARVVLAGSEKQPLGLAAHLAAEEAPPRPGQRITVSVVLKPSQPLKAANRLGRERLTRAQLRQRHGADSRAVKLVRAFAKEYGLSISPDTPAPEHRILRLTGTVAAMQRAFGVTLAHYSVEGNICRIREGGITLPKQLAAYVEAVLGLDNRPQAQPHFRIAGQQGRLAASAAQAGGFASPHTAIAHANAFNSSFTPVQIAQLYQWPANASAKGQTIGIIELGGGYRTADLAAYFKSLSQPAPQVTAVSVDGGKNSPSNANSADGEVMLDIEIAAAVAPGANIAVYFAPNTDQGFVDAVSTAVHDNKNNPSVVSISWGSAEANWTGQAMKALDSACQSAAALGVTITVAAGDNGSSDGATGNNVDFPASSPHVLACGGTKLLASNSVITSEVVWNELATDEGATGGGVSTVFPLPSWQSGAGVPKPTNSAGGRGVPDVAGDADPSTGYSIRVDGQDLVIGGTSAVAPLWAGLLAVANAQNGQSAGFLQPLLYPAKAKAAFRDITSGNNGAFSAGPGWDACTGLGSPVASQIIATVKPALAKKKSKKPPRPSGKPAKTRAA